MQSGVLSQGSHHSRHESFLSSFSVSSARASRPSHGYRNVCKKLPVCKITKSQPDSQIIRDKPISFPWDLFIMDLNDPVLAITVQAKSFCIVESIFLPQPPLSGIKCCHAIRGHRYLSQLHPVCSASRGTDCSFGCSSAHLLAS